MFSLYLVTEASHQFENKLYSDSSIRQPKKAQDRSSRLEETTSSISKSDNGTIKSPKQAKATKSHTPKHHETSVQQFGEKERDKTLRKEKKVVATVPTPPLRIRLVESVREDVDITTTISINTIQNVQQQKRIESPSSPSSSIEITPHYLNPKGLVINDIIKRIRVRSLWLGNHDTIAAVGSIITKLLTSKTLAHHWIEIETISNEYYCAQFLTYALLLSKRTTSDEVTHLAKSCVLNERGICKEHKHVWTTKYDTGDLILPDSKYYCSGTTRMKDTDNDDDDIQLEQHSTSIDTNINKSSNEIDEEGGEYSTLSAENLSLCAQNLSLSAQNVSSTEFMNYESYTELDATEFDNNDDNDNVSVATTSNNVLRMIDIINIMSKYEGKYHIIHNNCQDFCRWMFRQISEQQCE